MKQQKSCGIIPYTIKNNELYVMLIKQTNDVVCFPKGHVEGEETEEQTALRECMEETHTSVSVEEGFRYEYGYYMEEYDAYKTVVYFLGKMNTENFLKQECEISDIYFCTVKEAFERITYDNLKEALAKAEAFINKKI